jgi:hypothetical protein
VNVHEPAHLLEGNLEAHTQGGHRAASPALQQALPSSPLRLPVPRRGTEL